jgi:hypothetical protein
MKANKKKTGIASLKRVLDGGILTEESVSRQLPLLVLIVLLIIIFISNSYYCMKQLTDIEDLKERLKDAKYEHLIILTELTSTSRQSQVEELLEKKGMDLSGPTTPALEIRQ